MNPLKNVTELFVETLTTTEDSDDTLFTYHEIQRVSLGKLPEGDSVICYDELKSGDVAHIVTVRYTTGDSFGEYPGAGFRMVAAFRGEESAERFAHAIRAHSRIFADKMDDWDSRHIPALKEMFVCRGGTLRGASDLGFTYKYGSHRIRVPVDWVGYFETIDSISVESFVAE